METSSISMSGYNHPSDFQQICGAYAQFNIQHLTFNILKKMSNRFTSRLSDNDDFKRDELIRKIEHSVEHMTLAELEALSYDMFTKGYIQDY